jgi:hypothetical protein
MIPSELKELRQWILYNTKTKVPYHRISDAMSWFTWGDVLRMSVKDPDNFGVGFVFTKDDPYVGIDLDDCAEKPCDASSLSPWALKIIQEANSYTEWSPSGTGVHIICRGPHLETGFRKDGIEVYSHGRYFTMTGNNLEGYETINDATSVVESLVASRRPTVTKRDVVAQVKEEYKPHNYMERARAYVDNVPGAVSGQGGHDATYALACKLAVNFALTLEEGIEILTYWNSKCVPPWNEQELEHKMRSALRKQFKDNPDYMIAYIDDEEDVEFSAAVLANSLKRANEMPRWLLDVPGVLAGFRDWCMTQNHRRNEILALLGGIAWMAYCTGRKVQDSAGLRTNLYLVGLAPSAGGKQAPLECIKFLADAGNKPDAVIGKVTSDSAIARQLSQEPNSLCLWDEFGLFLQKTNAKGGNLGTVQDVLLELWGCTRTTWKAKTYADGGRDLKVVQPCFSLLGMTTPDHFWAGLTKMHLRDGFAGRLLVVDSGPRAERGEVTMTPPPGSLVDFTRHWTGATAGNLAEYGFGLPDLVVVKSTDAAMDIFDDLLERVDEETDDDKASVWGRAIEKARKLAMIWACAENPMAPVVDETAAKWGVGFASWATESFLARVDGQVVGEGDVHSRVTREVLAEIRKSGKASRKDLLRAVGADAKVLGSVLDTLVQADFLRMQKSGNAHVYYLR